MEENKGIISLISGFSVYCLITGGRVSLAHLVEFSHFIDLYVLENKIYCGASEKDLHLYHFNDDTTSPLLELPQTPLSDAIVEISDSTRGIYDAAPVQRTFSMDSYDYWIKLSSDEKRKLSFSPQEGIDWFGHSGLLHYSKSMDKSINIALEHLAETEFTLMPSSRNLLPFLSVFHQIDTPALMMYRNIASSHRQAVEKVLSLTRPRTVYLPPLLSVLLSRCKTHEDIPHRLIELREEFTDFRTSTARWFRELDTAKTLKDKIEIREELENSINVLTSNVENRRRGFYKELAGALISGIEDVDLKKMIIKPAFTLIKEGVTNIVPELLSVRRFTGLVDLMDEALQIKNYQHLLRDVFGDQLDISQHELTNVKTYRKYIETKFEIGLPSPS